MIKEPTGKAAVRKLPVDFIKAEEVRVASFNVGVFVGSVVESEAL